MDTETIQFIWPEELRGYMNRREERAYLLVDVRQPKEYEQEHLPGALLMPLQRLLDDVSQIPMDKELVFYCSQGGRSRVAAEACAESRRFFKPIYSLTGGLSAWDAAVVSGFPKVTLFENLQSSIDWAKTGMNLEKGAILFYGFLIQKCADEVFAKALEEISEMETAHARLLYHLFFREEQSTDTFQDVFGALNGDIIEGGFSLSDVCTQLERMPGGFLSNALDFALRIEYAAYDLYRTLANKTDDLQIRKALLTLSQAEKKHVMRVSSLFESAVK